VGRETAGVTYLMGRGHCIAPSSSFAEWESHLEATTDDAVHYDYVE
jgi:hypothetical protein